jgi:flagellar basal-body rod protein FlgB
MVAIIDNNTVGLLSLALDAATMRQQAIAQNIANANTPGYQRLGVSFEDHIGQLKQAVRQGQLPSTASLAAFQPLLHTVGLAGDAVSLENEMAALSENTQHHQALLKVLNKHMALISTAINEGKR